MKRMVSLFVVALLVMGALAGCAPAAQEPTAPAPAETGQPAAPASEPAPAASEVTLNWTSWALAEESLQPTYNAMAETFMEANKDVKIETSTQPYAQYLDQLLIAAAAGNTPDVAHIKKEWLPQFLALGAVKAIGTALPQEVLADYNPSAVESISVDGEMKALPWFSNTYCLLYNKELIEKAGITELPKTWNELLEAAYKVSALGKDENGNKIYGLAFPDSELEAGEGYNVFPALWANGGDFQDASGKINLTDAAAIKTYTEIQKLFVDEVSPFGGSFKDLRNLFGQGTIGFYWDLEATISASAAAAPDADKFYENLGVMVIPGGSSPEGHGYMIEHCLVVFKSCSDEKMEAMGRFLAHMSSEVVIDILYQAGQGKMTSRASVLEKVFGNVDNEVTKTYMKAMESARPLPTNGLRFMDADELLTGALTRLAQGGDVNEIMADTQARIQTLYDEG